MVQSRVIVGDLIQEGPYARRGTRAARYAARFYRIIILGITCAILLITYLQHRTESLSMGLLIFVAIAVYLLYSGLRFKLHATNDKLLYQPRIQMIRCQLGVLSISILIACLACFGVHNQELWLLYVLATLVLSESVATVIVLITLFEVAVLLFAAAYLTPMLWAGIPVTLQSIRTIVPAFSIHILYIWLLTFMLHYLVRNIQARQEAFSQHVQWRELIATQLQNENEPTAQRQMVSQGAAQLTGAEPVLWLPRLNDRQLVNDRGEKAPPLVELVGFKLNESAVVFGQAWQPSTWQRLGISIGRRLPPSSLRGLVFLPNAPTCSEASAQVFLPIRKPGGEGELEGVLELTYVRRLTSNFVFQLELDNQRLQDFVAELYVLLAISLKNERLQLLNQLAVTWDNPLDGSITARQVVQHVVSQLGFDFATVSVVEVEHQRIRCVEEQNASWKALSQHDLNDNDVQCLVVREGVTIVNEGEYESYLDKEIWDKYDQGRTTPIWVPVRQPHGKGPDVVFGTIEAGFHHEHCRKIPWDLQVLLEQYANLVYPILLNARQQTRNQTLLRTLERLHGVGQYLQQQAGVLKLSEMAEVIGRSAEELLDADLVMVFLPHKGRKRPKLAYITADTLDESLSPGQSKFVPYLSEALEQRLSSDRFPYFSPRAQMDSILVRFGQDGLPLPDGRSFTQRHQIQSFAGVPLATQSGEILAYVCLNYFVHREFYPEARQIVLLFAEQAAAALLQTQNQRFALNVAISHERSAMAAAVHNRLSAGLAADYNLAQTAMLYAKRHDSRLCGKLEELLASSADNRAALHGIIGDVRGTADPPVDLSASILAHIELQRFRHNGQILFTEAVDPAMVVPPTTRRGLISLLREALGNAVLHAPGARIEVNYSVDVEKGIELTVSDNGPGFDENRIAEKGRHGWFSLNATAAAIDAQVVLSSAPCRGTTVTIRVMPQSLEEHHE